MDDDQALDEMRIAVQSEKVGGDPAGWAAGSGHDSLILSLPLDVLAISVATTRLVLRAVRRSPDRDASATLVVTLRGQDLKAWRMDWRPVFPHHNACGPPNLKGLTVSTGIHEFQPNATLGLKRMQAQNLPVCVPVEPEPHDFDAFVRYVCKALNVTLTEQVLGPPWSPTLF